MKHLINSWLLKILLRLHSISYKYSGVVSARLNHGNHPKHRIMKYKEWFLDNIGTGCVVLDIGCNSGLMASFMAEKARYVYGIDIDCTLIDKAIENNIKKNIEFFCADAATFDYSPLEKIDFITLSNVLEHVDNRVSFLKRMIKQVKWKSNKRLLIRVPMIDREWITIIKKEMQVEWRLDETHYTEYTFDAFKEELADSGIIIESHHIRWGEIYAVCKVV
jgi:2-polyprenyl-3-methyl-5-hydroxy-6-metoxy-1,4-benzoquinol methylase